MKQNTILIVLLLYLTLHSCTNNLDNTKNINISSDRKTERGSELIDSLLKTATEKDSVIISLVEPFVYLRSGWLFGTTKKQALVITLHESKGKLELLQFESRQWSTLFSLSNIDISQIHFDAKIADYNFDDTSDLYIQQTASNGYIMSRGSLYTFDPRRRIFTKHPEVESLANMKPDKNSGVILSDEYQPCDNDNSGNICIVKSKWVNGQLKKISKDCPCDN